MEDTDAADRQVEEVESLCMNCHENGTTRLLLTRIPFFREIVLMSFSCPSCHFQNSEIQSAGEIQQRGVRFTFKLDGKDDLQRQIVKSDTCIARVEDIDLEIPAGRGQLTNIEGILTMVMQDLDAKQEERREIDESLYSKVASVIRSLAAMINGDKFPFTISLNDPAGNSSVEPSTADRSGKYVRADYARDASQNASLGLASGEQCSAADGDISKDEAPQTEMRPEYRATQMYPSLPAGQLSNVEEHFDGDSGEIIENQVYSFSTSCPGCTKACMTNMKMVRIPHFKEVVIMATVCDHCGYRTNEVKSGGEVPEKGRRITLQVLKPEDLSRDILKAESCALQCPQLSLSVEPGTLGGRFTTVEGILRQVRDDLRASVFDTDEGVEGGDSMAGDDKAKWGVFFGNLSRAIAGELQFTLVLEDPLAGSYVQSFTAPEPDEQITWEEYERTQAEEEHLGLRDMKTENYKEDHVEDPPVHESKIKKANGEDTGVDAAEVEREFKARLESLAGGEETKSLDSC